MTMDPICLKTKTDKLDHREGE